MIYKRGDKIMIIATGEVFTVFRDLGFSQEACIIVSEQVGRTLKRCEVRPAGYTRQHADLAKNITPPERIPPFSDSDWL